MNFFQKIEGAEHTFAAWSEKEFVKLYEKTPEIDQVTDMVLKYAGPVLQMVATSAGGTAAGNIVAEVISEAQADLVVASGLVYDLGPNPSATTIITSVQNNLQALLTAGHVSDTKSVGFVTKVVAELGALVLALAKVAAPAAPAATPVPAPVESEPTE